MSLEGNFNRTENKDLSYEATQIVGEIKTNYNNFMQLINELYEKSPVLKEAMLKYDKNLTIIFEDFKFTPWGENRDSEDMFGSVGLEEYMNGNKDYISIDNLNMLKDSFNEKLKNVLAELDKDFENKEDAFNAIRSVNKNIILKPVKTGRIFG